MAAAAIVEMAGGTPEQSAEAMAITLKNMLGLVCDPVAGLVDKALRETECDGRVKCDDCR